MQAGSSTDAAEGVTPIGGRQSGVSSVAMSVVDSAEFTDTDPEAVAPADAQSSVSTQDPALPLAPRAERPTSPPCRCYCRGLPDVRADRQGARRMHGRQGLWRLCDCPMCGQRGVQDGPGCRRRVDVPQRFQGIAICSECRQFCNMFLRWGDVFYWHGGVAEGGVRAEGS